MTSHSTPREADIIADKSNGRICLQTFVGFVSSTQGENILPNGGYLKMVMIYHGDESVKKKIHLKIKQNSRDPDMGVSKNRGKTTKMDGL